MPGTVASSAPFAQELVALQESPQEKEIRLGRQESEHTDAFGRVLLR